MKQSPASPATKNSIPTKIKKGLKLALATRYFNPKNWIRGDNYEHGSVFKTALENAKSLYIEKTPPRKETFDEACARLKLTEQDLQLRFRETVIASRACYFFSVVIILLGAFHAYYGNIAGGIGGAVMALTSMSFGMLRAYLAWRIKIKRLAPLREFLITPEAWFI